MIVTSDAGTVHLFDVKAAHEDRPINTVRSQEIRSFMKLKLEDLLLLSLKCTKTTSEFAKVSLTAANMGNVTVPGVKFISEEEDETGRTTFIVQVSSRWGSVFEVSFQCKDEAGKAPTATINSYQIINVYNLIEDKKLSDSNEELK